MILKLQNGKPLPSLETIKRLPKRQSVQKQQSIKAREKTERWTKEQINKAKNTRTWRSKIADALHISGVGLTGIGLIGSFVTAPAATALGIAGGIAGEKAVDKASKKITGRTWNENMQKYLGLGPTLSSMLNPGGWIGGGVGVKISKFRPKAGYLGMNGVPMERKPTKVENIFNFERWFRQRDPKYVTEQDKKILTEHLPEYKRIQEKALDEKNYMVVDKNFPGATQTKDGRYVFQGDEGSWIQSKSKDFKAKAKDKVVKIGYKGGNDQKAVEGMIQEHAPETFPIQDNGVFFAGPQSYANGYNAGKPAPGFWLFFRKPYDMLTEGKKPFLLEDNNIRFARLVESSPSFKGEFPPKTLENLNKVFNSEYLKNPEVMKIITGNPNTMNPQQLAKRAEILNKIVEGKPREFYNILDNYIKSQIKVGRSPSRGNYFDGYIGRDHALGYGYDNNGNIVDNMWEFGSNPPTYVIKYPQQASLLIGNNGSFAGPAYSRKKGGKLYERLKRFRKRQ